MDYNKIEDKYIKAEIKGHYKFENAAEVKEVLGYDILKTWGMKALSLEDRILAEKLMCNFLNGFGLAARDKIKITKIKREPGKFVLQQDDGYSYLYDDGTVG